MYGNGSRIATSAKGPYTPNLPMRLRSPPIARGFIAVALSRHRATRCTRARATGRGLTWPGRTLAFVLLDGWLNDWTKASVGMKLAVWNANGAGFHSASRFALRYAV